jgi:hypothetical protein
MSIMSTTTWDAAPGTHLHDVTSRMTKILIPCALSFAGVFLGNALDSKTNVPLGEALAVGVIVVPATIWLGRFMQKVNDNQGIMQKMLDVMDNRLTDLERGFSHLNCQRVTDPCPGTKSKIHKRGEPAQSYNDPTD